jgi:pimeloyl-ACP methyl ester carboxylesterase
LKEILLAAAYLAVGGVCVMLELDRARSSRSQSKFVLVGSLFVAFVLWPLWAPFAIAPGARENGRSRRGRGTTLAGVLGTLGFRRDNAPPRVLFRILSMAFALVVLPLALAFGVAVVACRLSAWSALVAFGLGLLALGLVGTVLGFRLARALVSSGVLFFLGPVVLRAVSARGDDGFRLTTLPGDGGTRIVNTLVPERDGCLLAAFGLRMSGRLRDEEATDLGAILERSYERIETSEWRLPTPAIATYLGRQTPSDFDAIVIEPPKAVRPSASPAAVVFLHGYAGNFHVYCWELARAAGPASLVTVCPSLDASAAWWTERGDDTFEKTLAYLRGRGITRVYLAGLSNGAAGASTLALRHERELAGLVLVSGMRAERPPALPTLVVQGSRDRMMPAAFARAYAAKSARATYREIPGGHFVFLSKSELVRPAIAEFLSENQAGH